MENERGLSERSFLVPGSEPKGFSGKKRACEEVEESSKMFEKRVKMRDLDSVIRSGERRTSDIVPNNLRASHMAFDLNTQSCTPSDMATNGNIGLKQVSSLPSSRRPGMESETGSIKFGGFGFDLNAGDISSSNNDSVHGYDKYDHLKLKDESECVSSVGPLDEKDPMKVWKEMKENGFLSSSHGGVPMPRKRGRKSKNDGIKKKMELAKKEQVDRFAKIAAPSGLLSELNPGIINHVRNSKQVRSIIEALVKSEKLENQHARSKGGDQLKSGLRESCEKKDLTSASESGLNRRRVTHESVSVGRFADSSQMTVYPPLYNNSLSLNSELVGEDDESSLVDTRDSGSFRFFSHIKLNREDDMLMLKLSSSTAMASENNSSLTNEKSTNCTSVSSLSVNAATVASQWLDLLHQDIKGRLAALRRSKRRVQAVIQTELPFLLSKEFPPVNENNSCDKKSCTSSHSYHLAADMHLTRWTALFDQMDKTLSEEENQLECWLNQIGEMQGHCDKGLLKFHNIYGLQQPGPTENEFRFNKSDNSQGDSAVQAAAASIYSTCNFLSSMENFPCF